MTTTTPLVAVPHLLLIAGRPGAGKTEFCQWLRREQGYHAIETDDPTEQKRWGPLLGDPDPATALELRRNLEDWGEHVAFEWGFPVPLLQRVVQLIEVGLDPWWFDGDEAACRAGWIERHPGWPLEVYEGQAGFIAEAWPRIEPIFKGRVIEAVGPGRRFIPFDEIFARISP